LIRPPSDFEGVITVPIGLLYLASSIKDIADVKIIDGVVDKIKIDEIKEFKPDYVGITGTNSDYSSMNNIVDAIKDKIGCIVIVGGPYVSCATDISGLNKNIDIVIRGEGEHALREIVQKGLKKGVIKGEYLADMDSCVPSWDLIRLDKYFKGHAYGNVSKSNRHVSILTSRGCPYSCIYCAGHLINGKKWRARSPESIFKEIEYLYRKFKIKEFHIIDDTFNLNIERAEKVFDLIINSRIKIYISFPNGIRADRITPRLLGKMKKAGVYKISYGIESGSPRIQKLIKKELSLDKVKETIRLTVKNRIIPQGFFMIGFPTETEEDYRKTVDFAKNSDLCFASFHKVLSFEGTELHSMTRHSAMDRNYMESDLNYSKIKNLDKKVAKAKREFYLSPKRIWLIFRLVPKRYILENIVNLPKLFVR